MSIKASIPRDELVRHMTALGPQMQDAGNRAVERQTKETLLEMRGEATRGLSARAANALRSRVYPNPSQDVGGFIFSAWRRKPRSGGQDIDMFAAYERGDVIRPVRGKYLCIPLPAAYSVVGVPKGIRTSAGLRKNRPDPRTIESVLGVKLFKVSKAGRQPILAVSGVNVGGAGRGKIRARHYYNKRGGVSTRRGSDAVIPMFVLLRNARLPKRLDFSRVEEMGAAGLASKIEIELAARGVFS